jgi:hypothetical protein
MAAAGRLPGGAGRRASAASRSSARGLVQREDQPGGDRDQPAKGPIRPQKISPGQSRQRAGNHNGVEHRGSQQRRHAHRNRHALAHQPPGKGHHPAFADREEHAHQAAGQRAQERLARHPARQLFTVHKDFHQPRGQRAKQQKRRGLDKDAQENG